MDHYKKDLANNIIALAYTRSLADPKHTDNFLFKNYFKNSLAPAFKEQYGIKLRYNSYKGIIKQVNVAIAQEAGNQ